MEILQLRYFCDAAKTQNFSKTAKKYNVPASNISQSVHRLEKELDAELFDRSANRISLNEKGTLFYKKIVQALENIDEARNIAMDYGDKTAGEIRLKICTDRQIITGVIEKFRLIYPDVSFAISHNINDEGKFDVIISDDVIRYRNMEKTLFLTEKIAIAANINSRVAKEKISDVSKLAGESYIAMQEGSSLWRVTRQICAKYGFEPNISIQSDDPFYVRKYVEMGMGIAFVPAISWEGQFSENVCLIELESCERKTYIFTENEKYMTKAVRKFCKMLTDSTYAAK